MEALDHELIAIVKGKRTKRQPPLQSSNGDGDYGGNKALVVVNGFSSSTSSAEYYDREGTTTEEEEDMANCLILLAQGHWPKRPAPKSQIANLVYGKFTSRKYLETDMGSGKVGYYVYECKMCNRTFPSFQALGGHRASHKKQRVNPVPAATIPSSHEEDRPGELKKYSTPSLQLGSVNGSGGNLYGHNSNAATANLGKQGKVHVCSICGAEFALGQALGGHMRRHRVPPALPLPQIGITKLVDPNDEATAMTPTVSLDLDLNLPAPGDQSTENVFLPRQQKKQQPLPAVALVFSAAAMVDCHY